MDIPLDFKLETARCVLSCVSDDDVESVWSATRYPGFNDGMPWNAPKSKSEIFPKTQHHLGQWLEGNEFVFSIRSGIDNGFIGRVAIRREEGDSVWSVGFWVHPAFWGKGFATEASGAIIDFGFDRLAAKKIIAAHALWNAASKRVMAKLGLKYVRDNPKGFRKDGGWVAEAEYEMNAHSWISRRGHASSTN